MCRALARVRDGKVLDVHGATVLLGARDEDLTALCATAARLRDQVLADADADQPAADGDVLPQGARAADAAVP